MQTQVEIDKTTRLCLDQVKESETLGKDGENGMFVCRATLIDIRTDKATYPACEKCHKKLVEVHGSAGRCEMCHKTVPVTYRSVHCTTPAITSQTRSSYNLPAVFGESTNRAWFTLFNGSAERLLGMNANDFMSIKVRTREFPSVHYWTLLSGKGRREVHPHGQGGRGSVLLDGLQGQNVRVSSKHRQHRPIRSI